MTKPSIITHNRTMTANEANKAAIIQALPWLMPPKGVIHVGIGAGTGPMQKWRDADITKALIIDANLPQLNWLNTELQNHPQWQVQQAILSAQAGEADFHTANNPMESGLCPPSLFNNFWPNLATTNAQSLPTKSLDTLLQETDTAAEHYDWLCVDCLPSLEILRGAEKQLEHINVVWARVILKPQVEQLEYGLDKLEDYLIGNGFKLILIVEENHPAFASVIFLRDWPVKLNNLTTKQQARIEALTQERDTHAQQSAQRQSQIEALNQAKIALEQEKSALIERSDTLTNEVATLIQARDEQNKLAGERQARIEALVLERDTHAQQSAQRQTQIEALDQTKVALEQEKSALIERSEALANEVAALSQARDEQVKLATERQAKIVELVQQCNTHQAQANEIQVRLDALNQTNTQLTAGNAELVAKLDSHNKDKSELSKALEEQNHAGVRLKKDFEQLQAQLQQQQGRIAELESELSERDARQLMLNEEMIKAEAQIDLIKDVLLREPGL